MKKPKKALSIIVGVILAFSLITSEISEEKKKAFQEGHDAYVSGDYLAAVDHWLPLAKKGVAEAQHNLGLMLARGEGVGQDNERAFKWFKESAEQGYAPSQNALGLMYLNGEGISRDIVRAYAWLQLAVAQGSSEAKDNLELIRFLMTESQIADAEELRDQLNTRWW